MTLEDFGMIIKLSEHIKGLCPRTHLADMILKHPEKRLTEGKKVKCRVSVLKDNAAMVAVRIETRVTTGQKIDDDTIHAHIEFP